MSDTTTALPSFDWVPLDAAGREALARDWNQYLPRPPLALESARVSVARLPFYDDYRLLRVEAGESAWFLHAPGDLRPLDASARAIDRVNLVAPLVLDSRSVIPYLLLRLAFTLSIVAPGAAGQRGLLLLAPALLSDAHPADPAAAHPDADTAQITTAPAGDRQRPAGAAVDDAWRVALSIALPTAGGPTPARLEAVVSPTGATTVVRIDALTTANRLPAHSPTALTCPRIRPAPAWITWQSPSPELRAELERILDPWKIDLQAATLRLADPGFHRRYRLLEITEPGPTGWRRSYAMVAPFEPGLDEPVIALDGTSPPIHRVNALPDEFQANEQNVDAYLAFFCWAVQGEEGSFLIPANLHSLPWRRAPEAGIKAVLERDFDWGFHLVPEQEDQARGLSPRVPGEHRRRVIMAYSNALFDALLAVKPDGMVDMLDDTPRMVDLPIRGERFGSPRLAIPKRYRRLGHHLLADRSIDRLPVPATGDDTVARTIVSAAEFVRRLCSDEPVDGLEVDDAQVHWQPVAPFDSLPRVARNCVLRHGLVLHGSEVRAPLVFVDCRIEGGLSARGARLAASLTFVGCRIFARASDGAQVAIDLRNAEFESEVEFFACICQGRLEGSSLQAGRDLRLRGCSFVPIDAQAGWVRVEEIDSIASGRSSFRTQSLAGSAAVTLLQAKVAGELEIAAAGDESAPRIGGATTLALDGDELATVVRGTLDLSAIEAGSLCLAGTVVTGPVLLGSARITHALHLCLGGDAPVHAGRHFACTNWFDMSSAHVGGHTDLRTAHIGGDFLLYQSTLENNLLLSGMRIDGDLNASFSTIRAFVMAFASPGWLGDARSHLSIGGRMEISGAEMRFVELRGIEIEGDLRIHASRFSSFRILPAIRRFGTDTDGSGRYWIAENRMRSISISAVVTDSDLSLVDIRTEAPDSVDQSRGDLHAAFIVNHCTIGGDLTLSMPRPHTNLARRFAGEQGTLAWQRPEADTPIPGMQADHAPALGPSIPSQADVLTMVWGDLDLRANRIAGGLDLRNLRVEGQMLLNDTRVGLDLQLGADYELEGSRYTQLSTECAHLDLEKLECGGDVDLSGLRIRRPLAEAGEPPASLRHVPRDRLGVLAARGMTVKGELLLAPREPRKRRDEPSAGRPGEPAGYIARIDGEVDLTGATAAHLVLSGDSLGALCRLVRLEGGSFDRFELIDPPPDKPIDLSEMSTGRWLFSNESSCDPAPVSIIEAVLRNMPTLDRKAWLAIETSLRNEGRDVEANRIYLAMRREARRRRKADDCSSEVPAEGLTLTGRLLGLMERAWDRLHDFATRYGTEVRRPMLPALLLVPLSLWIFSDPRNVTASTDLLQVIGDERITIATAGSPRAGGQPDWLAVGPDQLGVEWSLTDAFALTVRYQVPIIGVLTHDRWEASARPLPVLGASAEDYAFWIEIYHWIAWPLFLIGAAAGAFRGRR